MIRVMKHCGKLNVNEGFMHDWYLMRWVSNDVGDNGSSESVWEQQHHHQVDDESVVDYENNFIVIDTNDTSFQQELKIDKRVAVNKLTMWHIYCTVAFITTWYTQVNKGE